MFVPNIVYGKIIKIIIREMIEIDFDCLTSGVKILSPFVAPLLSSTKSFFFSFFNLTSLINGQRNLQKYKNLVSE